MAKRKVFSAEPIIVKLCVAEVRFDRIRES
jgi:hypothetical protein